jgi:hypothetical protein
MLEAAGCQAFVDKPVIESELLAALQRELELEWVAELAVPSWVAVSAPQTGDLQIEHARTLLRLARMGHPQGLQRALDALVAEYPAQASQADALRELVGRFDWPQLIERLDRAVGEANEEAL